MGKRKAISNKQDYYTDHMYISSLLVKGIIVKGCKMCFNYTIGWILKVDFVNKTKKCEIKHS